MPTSNQQNKLRDRWITVLGQVDYCLGTGGLLSYHFFTFLVVDRWITVLGQVDYCLGTGGLLSRDVSSTKLRDKHRFTEEGWHQAY